MIECLSPHDLEKDDLPALTTEDIIVLVRFFDVKDYLSLLLNCQIATFDYGKKAENPIDFTYFYTKENPDKASRVKKHQV